MNNKYNDKKGRYEFPTIGIEQVDQSVVDYFDKKLKIHVQHGDVGKKVPVVFAAGERWKMIRDNKGLRDDKGTLILPIIAIKRTDIDRTLGFHGLGQEVSSITISKRIHQKNSLIQNLVQTRIQNGYPQAKPPVVYEYLTIPFPDMCIISYEASIWSQYQTQMNEILEKIFYSYEYYDSFVIPLNYPESENSLKGSGRYFVGYREGNISFQSNVEDFTDNERIIKYNYSFKVPVNLILDPKENPLSYGKKRGNSKNDTGKHVVYKEQSVNQISLSEEVIGSAELEKLLK